MDYCKCGQSAVDLEEHYSRTFGSIKEIKITMTNERRTSGYNIDEGKRTKIGRQ